MYAEPVIMESPVMFFQRQINLMMHTQHVSLAKLLTVSVFEQQLSEFYCKTVNKRVLCALGNSERSSVAALF